MSDHLLIYCTCPDQGSAQSIANTLVDKGLAACVNILPGVYSVYRWEGKRENAQEHLLTIKTLHSAYETLEQAIVEMHPYELPEIIAVPITHGLAGYLAWIDENVTNENQ
ncbi:MAG TPA: divalent-cation tolerance protein CutA [Chromatiales bacterium]|nr:divalent-cation tolerance protein CutA [Chromatiales bacterium]HEX21958.1 divalent-cation tolerance protein CutA [Chromatiales bacterium]